MKGFTLNLLQEILGLPRKKELRALLFPYLSNASVSLSLSFHPPLFRCPLHPCFVTFFRKAICRRHQQWRKQHVGRIELGTSNLRPLQLSTVCELARYYAVSSANIPRKPLITVIRERVWCWVQDTELETWGKPIQKENHLCILQHCLASKGPCPYAGKWIFKVVPGHSSASPKPWYCGC